MEAFGARYYCVHLHIVFSQHSLLISGLILVCVVDVTVSARCLSFIHYLKAYETCATASSFDRCFFK